MGPPAGRGEPVTTALRLEGPAPEQQLARDLARRAVPVAPVLLIIGALGWGYDGAFSAGYGVALVVLNFLLAAAFLTWAGRISLGFLMGAALGGYILRLGLLAAAVLLVRDAGWVEPVPLGLTVVVTHLGLLVWETRYVSASLAFPVLKPRKGALR